MLPSNGPTGLLGICYECYAMMGRRAVRGRPVFTKSAGRVRGTQYKTYERYGHRTCRCSMDPISFYLQPKRATAATMPQVLSAAPHAPSKGCQSATKAARSRHSPLPPSIVAFCSKGAVGRSKARRPDLHDRNTDTCMDATLMPPGRRREQRATSGGIRRPPFLLRG